MRSRKDIPEDELLALKQKGWSNGRLAKHFDVSLKTINRRLASLTEKKENVMDFVKLLSEVAERAPRGYCRNELKRLQKTILERHPASEPEKKNLILKAIESGARAVVEIAEDCFLSREETEDHLRSLVSEKKIIERFPEGVKKRGRRMKLQYFLTPIVP